MCPKWTNLCKLKQKKHSTNWSINRDKGEAKEEWLGLDGGAREAKGSLGAIRVNWQVVFKYRGSPPVHCGRDISLLLHCLSQRLGNDKFVVTGEEGDFKA